VNQQIDIKPIIDEFGPPGYDNKKGELSRVNENFWAAFYAKQKTEIIYEPSEREFYDFADKDGIFIPKSSDLIRTELSALMLEAARDWPGHNALERFRDTKVLAGIVAQLRGHVEERDFFNHPQHHYAHLANCTLRFESDGSNFTIEGFSHLHRNRNRSPIKYDPDATCPKFLKHILGHVADDDKLLLKKYSGQCVLGRNITQRFGILDGIGGSSKGAFVLTLAGIVGLRNVYELRTEHLGERFEIGRMIGRTLLLGADVRNDFMSRGGAYKIKSLVGGDVLEAELKGSNSKFLIYGPLIY
jgi:phage/plasmid-associated DNA primase